MTTAVGSPFALDGRPSRLVPNTVLALAAVASTCTWLSPNLYEPWLSFHGELWMAVAGLLAAAVVLSGPRAQVDVPFLAIGLLLAAAVPVVQGLTGRIRYAGDAWLVSLYLAGAGFAVWTGFLASARWSVAAVAEAVLGAMLAGAIGSMFLALCQWLGLDHFPIFVLGGADGLRPSGNIGQPNLFATLLVVAMTGLALLHRRGRVGAPVALVAVLFLGFGVAMSQSRTALVETIAVGALLAGFAWRAQDRRRAVTIVLASAGVLLMPFLWEAVRHWSPFEVAQRGVADIAVAGVRPKHWAALLDALGRAPWFGYGWSAVGEAQFLVAPEHPATHETLANAHNLVLELLLANGIPLGTLLVVGLGAWFWTTARRLRDDATVVAFAAVLAVFVHAMLEFPLHYVDFLVPTAALMGCVTHATRPSAGRPVPSVAPWLLWTALAVAVAVTAVDYLRFEAERRHMRFKAANIGTPVTHWERSDRIVLTQLGAFWNFMIEPERAGMSDAQIDAMRDVVLRFPSVENMLRYAAALALNDRPAEAAAVLSRGCRMTPVSHCRDLNRVWVGIGKREPKIAAIRWPGLPSEP
jgi:O-antigen ligase